MDARAEYATRETSFRLFGLMVGVFLGGGLLNSVEALLVPRLKLLFGLGYAEALLIQLVYYAGYLIFAVPAALLTAWAGPMRAVAIGLAVMATGCFAFAITQASFGFAAMLGALSLVSSGVTILQIASNGAMATHGKRDRAASRFTLLQGFNSLGTVVGPLIGAWFLLGRGNGGALGPFLGFGIFFAVLAAAFAFNRDLIPQDKGQVLPTIDEFVALIRQPSMLRGVAAIFAYVGAEVAIGTLAVNYLMLSDRLGLTALVAGKFVSIYWAGAMLGRFVGAMVLRHVRPRVLLSYASLAAMLLVACAILERGALGGAALLGVGLCNSIMFPTIYALAMPTKAKDVPVASMLLCMAVVGGAIIPMMTGLVADRATLAIALVVPATCYIAIFAFARSHSLPFTKEFA